MPPAASTLDFLRRLECRLSFGKTLTGELDHAA